ncbi:MAG: HPr(Ser) kinase/phosphatase [Bacteroidetes bacterium]|nr:HPr(Ser) kinase/phosphatase [Bacteroidota bacterium]
MSSRVWDTKEIRRKDVSVGELYKVMHERTKLEPINGTIGFNKLITDKNVHRPGLALAGYVELFSYNRVQIFGNTEVRYLSSMKLEDRRRALQTIFQFDIPCVVIANSNEIEQELIDIITSHGVSVFRSTLETTRLVYFLGEFLDEVFAPSTVIHGSLVDVYGIGVLFVGLSGIGKSEIALDLVERGHRLVADDAVNVYRQGEDILIGRSSRIAEHFMEVRGLGVIDVRSIFGIRAVRKRKRIEVVVELEEWDSSQEYTRTGLDHEHISILSVEIPLVKLPILPGKNITVIAEVIALNHLLLSYDYDAAEVFNQKIQEAIRKKRKQSAGASRYFERDFE